MKGTTVFCMLSRHIFVGQHLVTNLLPHDKNFVGQKRMSFYHFNLFSILEKKTSSRILG